MFVVGSSGSGKSTLAAHLARSLGRPRVDLDTVAFVDQAGTRRDVADSVARVEAADPEGGAVIEGCYADLIGALGTVRDHLIWLDLPVPVCVARARGRAWEPHKWPSAEAQDAFLPTLIRFIEAYPTQEGPTGRPAHQALFEGFAGVRSWWRSDVDRREG